ncbi:MAG: hypothetical protein AVDCRST_MAG59-2089 [uncultured Thermomicrobiales bacterium]|uniref:Uncharacterized protein n=1 Tax=uncultured Thermomicrobiales bacterium TaxID=1645740 RepID=A0A6J4UMM7_9BACT|nr:MAG: hypothetical protein AVDCRST_MAG59-2089 [uncultured Thermomicrobiales bacterium]
MGTAGARLRHSRRHRRSDGEAALLHPPDLERPDARTDPASVRRLYPVAGELRRLTP